MIIYKIFNKKQLKIKIRKIYKIKINNQVKKNFKFILIEMNKKMSIS